MLRVLQMIGSLNVGGSQTMMLNLLRNIDRERLIFDFILDHPQERYFAKEAEALGARIYELPGFTGFNAGEVKNAWEAFLTEHAEYRILHSHVRSYASLYLPIAKRHGLKTIIHSHSTSNGGGVASIAKQILQRPLRNQADILMACSQESGEWLFGKDACKGEKFVFMPNAVDTSRFRISDTVRNEYRKELSLGGKLVIGHVGRFHPTKNHAFMLDTFKTLHDTHSASALLLVGDGELKDAMQQKAQELELTDCVHFLGNRNDVPELLSAMDVFMFPSVWEGLPVTLIEAQAAGLPCFVSSSITRAVDISPLIEYLPIDDPAQWADAILKAPKKTDVTDYIIKAGFDVKDSAKKISDIYYQLAGENIDV